MGEISLECSRPGASAVALWATQKLLPLVNDGEFAQNLNRSREAALLLYDKLLADERCLTFFPPELDIVIWAPKAQSLSHISGKTKDMFQSCATKNLHLAVSSFPAKLLPEHWSGIAIDQDHVSCIRSCLMKPEHLDWMDKIWEIIDNEMNL